MGGCNSVWKRIALGADRLSNPDAKSSCDKSKTGIVNATNQIIAMSVIQSLQSCCQQASAIQTLQVTCDPDLAFYEGVFESNAACGNCLQSVYDSFKYQHQLEELQWEKDKSQAKVRLPMDTELEEMIERVQTCGLGPCKACSLINITQSNILHADQTCFQTVADSTSLRANMTGLITQQLTQNQDVLAGVAQAFGNPDVATISESLTNLITSNNFTDILQNTMNQLSESQTLSVDGENSSVRNITQMSVFTAVVHAMNSANIVTQNVDSTILDTIEQVVQQQNTLNDFGEVIFESSVTLTQAIDNIVGRIMIATLVALGLVVMSIIGYLFYQAINRGITDAEELNRVLDQRRAETVGLNGF